MNHSLTWRQRLSFGYIGAIYVWAAIIVIFAIATPHQFLETYTIRAVVNNYSITGLAALAVLVPMAAGTFDASIGGNISLSGVICAYLLIHTGLSIPEVVLLSLASGLALGLVNVLVVVVLGIPSLIGTLATWLIADSLSVAISDNATLSSPRISGAFSRYLSNANWSGFAIPIVFVLVIAVIMGITLSRTVSGRYTFAVGFSLTASKLAGIRVKAIQSGALLCSGLVGAIAGVVLAAHVSSATPAIGDSYLLPAFAAVFVGATQFSTKRFNATGTVIAVFMLGTGEYGLLVLGAPQWTPGVFQGVALVAAIGLTHLYDPGRSTRRLRAKAASACRRRRAGVRAASGAGVRSPASPAPAVPLLAATAPAAVSTLQSVPVSQNGASSVPVEIVGLSKTFPGQRALIDVSMDVRAGEIHALLGQNGSGKSTLIKILAGIYRPDSGGVVRVAGQDLPFGSPRESRRMGLQFVHQSLGIIEELTAVENIALGFGYVHRAGLFINWRAQRKKTKRLLKKLSVDFDIDRPVSELRPVDRSAVAIARALDDDDGAAKVLVLDEPTAALPPHEVDALFSLVRKARSDGTSVIYVSHRLNEIFQLADRTTVLRDGVSQGTVNVRDIDHSELVRMIVGDDTLRDHAGAASSAELDGGEPIRLPSAHTEQVALRVRNLVAQRLEGIDFDLKLGEIVGVAGLTGSGREELAGALVGERPSHVDLENIDGKRRSDPTPRQAKDLGVVLVLPNRASGAAILEFTMRENISLPSLSRDSSLGFISRSAEYVHSKHWIEALDIRPRDPERIYALLSGGNQQKVVFAKWLCFSPKVMVIEDPTSGVDVGARQAIYDLVRHQASAGVSFVVCSSDPDDLLAVCDRILVLNEGRIVDQLVGSDIEESRLLMAMVGASKMQSVSEGSTSG